jgi:uncharacterized protein (TIGR02145 family)
VLYNYNAALGACPEGWHLPDKSDYEILLSYIESEYNISNSNEQNGAGNALKSCRQNWTNYGCNCQTNQDPYWDVDFNDLNFGTNSLGFNVLPAGGRYGGFGTINEYATFWSVDNSPIGSSESFAISLRNNLGIVLLYDPGNSLENQGYSVRCVKEPNTEASLPTISVFPDYVITESTVFIGAGNIDDGEDPILEKGFIYSLIANPTTENCEGIVMSGIGDNSFYSTLAGLIGNSTYYIKAFAQNNVGIGYSDEVICLTNIFSNCGTITDSRDGNTYNTINIGQQCWMAENLKYLPQVTGPNNQWNSTSPRYAVYGYVAVNNSVTDAMLLGNYQNYGTLYNWSAAITACPDGWHLPNRNEWDVLIDYLSSDFNISNENIPTGASYALRSCRSNNSVLGCNCLVNTQPYWYSTGISNTGTNLFGFSALPNGQRFNYGNTNNLGTNAKFWTNDVATTDNSFSINMTYSRGDVMEESLLKVSGLAVRCVKDFDPLALLPSVETIAFFNQTANSVEVEADVINDGGAVVITKGFVYSFTSEPTIESNLGMIESGSGTGNFTSVIRGLVENSNYFIRAFATNSTGTSYGNELNFTTIEFENCGLISDVRDGTIYKTIKIGTQCWMAENLKYLPEVTGPSSQWNIPAPRYSVYDYTSSANNVSNAKSLETYNSYGVLYNWYAAQDACPAGWQLPDSINWKVLIHEIETEYAIFNQNTTDGISNMLKSCRQTDSPLQCGCSVVNHPVWNNSNNTIFGIDLFGFSALTGGRRIYYNEWEDFNAIGGRCYFWSANELDSIEAITKCLYSTTGNLFEFEEKKTNGFSIRCVKSFEVGDELPNVISLPATDITNSSATVGGELLEYGEFSVAYTGVIIGESENITLENNLFYLYNDFCNAESFSFNQNGLESGKTYYYEAFAITTVGVFYGELLSFVTGVMPDCGQLVDNRDGESYNTILIGEQCWMAENLRYLPEVTGPDNEIDNSEPQYSVYNYLSLDNSVENAKLMPNFHNHGVLYNWQSVTLNGIASSDTTPYLQGVCPTGWHIPNHSEWKDLEMTLGMNEESVELYTDRGTNEGSKLSGNYLLWNDGVLKDDEAFGISGFFALASGYRSLNSGFEDFGNSTLLWSSNFNQVNQVLSRYLNVSSSEINIMNLSTDNYSASLRCVKNNSLEYTLASVSTSDISLSSALTVLTGGIVIDDGGLEVTQRGVVWSTNPNPSLIDNVGFSDDGQWTGVFNSNISGLIQGTTYYFRAYATNLLGTAYGNEIVFFADYCNEMTVNIVSSSPQLSDDGFINVCWDESLSQSFDVVLTAQGIYPEAAYLLDDENVMFKWYLDDDITPIEGIGLNTITYTFAEQRGYNIRLIIEDQEGCVNTNTLNQKIRVSFTPVWNTDETYLSPYEINLGDEVEMCAAYTTQSWNTGIAYQLFENIDTIPINDYSIDPPYEPTTSSIEVNSFYPEQYFSSENQLNAVSLNLVHSMVGDLTMFLECPNGQTVQLLQHIGSSINLGIIPDIGFWYSFTPTASQTLQQAVAVLGSGPVPEGNYLPFMSFNSLIGCPMNGIWTVKIYDNWSADVGKLNGWKLDFSESAFPELWGYTNTYNSISWTGNYGAQIDNPFDENCTTGTYLTTNNPFSTTVQEFVFSLTNDFGCVFDTVLDVTVLAIEDMDLPIVEISNVNQTSNYSAVANGIVIDEGGSPIIEKGFIWSQIDNPTIIDYEGISFDESGNNDFSSLIDELVPSETYFIRAFATNSSGTAYSNSVSLNVINEIGSDDYSKLNLILFPNPAKKIVKVLNIPEMSKLEIYDIVGKLVHSEIINNKAEIDISNIENGTYVFVVYSEKKGLQIQKLVKQ